MGHASKETARILKAKDGVSLCIATMASAEKAVRGVTAIGRAIEELEAIVQNDHCPSRLKLEVKTAARSLRRVASEFRMGALEKAAAAAARYGRIKASDLVLVRVAK